MENTKLKHIAVVEAESKAELFRKINEAIDTNGLDLIHYSIEQGINTKNNWEEIWMAEIFFTGPMVFDYNLSGGDKLLSNWTEETKSR